MTISGNTKTSFRIFAAASIKERTSNTRGGLDEKRKYFSATPPNNLINYVKDKEEKIKELISKVMVSSIMPKQGVKMFMGWKGIYFVFNYILEVLPKGSDYTAFMAGVEEDYSEKCISFFKSIGFLLSSNN